MIGVASTRQNRMATIAALGCWLLWSNTLPAQGTGAAVSASIPSPHSQLVSVPQADTEFPELVASGKQEDDQGQGNGAMPMVSVVSSLTIVLGLFGGLVFLARKFGHGNVTAGSLPNDVLQSLGSTAVDARTRVTMFRCGRRIIVAAQTAGGIHPLCEITDPQEVHELTAVCTGQSQASFAETLKAAQQRESAPPQPTRRRSLFATA